MILCTFRRKFSFAVVFAACAFCLSHSADAQEAYPHKPITLVWPYAPGGPDRIVRLVAQKMSEVLKQPVIVESKPGASGIIGAQFVQRAKPDGYTVLISGNSSLVIYPLLRNPAPLDVLRDFEPVTAIFGYPMLLAVPASMPVSNFKEYVTQIKQLDGKANYGSPGVGSAAQMGSELLKQTAGLKLTHIAYKGVGEAQQALMANDIQMFMDGPQSANELIKAGRVKALAITGVERNPVLSNVPTFTELGYPQMKLKVWIGAFAPKGTPAPIVKALSDAMAAATSSPEVRNDISQGGLVEIMAGGSERLQQMVLEERPVWAKLIDELGLKVE